MHLAHIHKIPRYFKILNYLKSDNKRFWFETLKNITDKIKNRSFPLNHQQFPKAFELNDDYVFWPIRAYLRVNEVHHASISTPW